VLVVVGLVTVIVTQGHTYENGKNRAQIERAQATTQPAKSAKPRTPKLAGPIPHDET